MGSEWLNLGQMLAVNAAKFPDRIAIKDRSRSCTYSQFNKRVNKLANTLLSLNLLKGDKVSCLLENCIEIVELYMACAKTGVVLNPINFRLSPNDIAYIADNADSKFFFTEPEFTPVVDAIKSKLPRIRHFFLTGKKEMPGYAGYETTIANSPETEPVCAVNPEDTWVILYTSGTTGKPKGVIRSHESYTAFYLINAVDFGFTENDICMTVMPLCHVNSTFFSFIFPYLGGTIYVHPARKFDPVEILEIIQKEKISFISLIPTHYSIILSVPENVRAKYNVSSVTRLLCSSAPARGDIKKRIMDYFSGVRLYEGYGSTEAGIVTVLKPHEQMVKLGSIGRESCGTALIKLLNEKGCEVSVGEVGEIFSRSPMLFNEYYKLPEKTAAAFRNGWFSAGDLGRKDEDGYFYIVDRKDNMIITGGEHVYPSEVEEVISRHSKVFETAVIGVPDEKWGEAVIAIVILKECCQAEPEEIIDFCKDKMAGFKKPKKAVFIKPNEMPRTASGKILHRELRKRYSP